MFLCYADESGYNGKKFNCNQPVQTMVAIMPNLYNFHRSDSEFEKVLRVINDNVIPLSELKGEQIYRGRGEWGKVKPEIRDKVIEFYLDWIKTRNHKLIVTAIDNQEYFTLRTNCPNNPFLDKLPYPYILSGLHIALLVQKYNRIKEKNKGKTILILDEQDDEMELRLSQLIFNPPDYIDQFVEFDEEKERSRLNQIVDTVFFVKSHHSSMTQVVDIVAFLFRLYFELNNYGFEEAYHGEKAKISKWIRLISKNVIPFSKIYPKSEKDFIKFINSTHIKGVFPY